jgi:SAM-dependent methyltransferase
MTTTTGERREGAFDEGKRDAFAERLLQSVLGAFDLFGIYLGDRLGLYRALSAGAATPTELARRAGCDERYMREWLEQQAATGVLELEPSDDVQRRHYRLSAEHAEVLLDRDSLNYLAPLAQLAVGALGVMPRLREAYRTGAGIPFADYGEDVRVGQAGVNRAMFLQLMPEWLAALPELHARLSSQPSRIADIGAGAAWSSVGLARAYPLAAVDAYDLDEASVALARANVADAGVAARVRVHLADAGDPALDGAYDLVAVFEALHDMARPVDTLRTVRRLLAPPGVALVVDERVADELAAPGDDIERLMYGWSIFHCLPAGRAESPSAATGTVMREATLRGYAVEAGFQDVEVLPVENLFFRFYRLVP